VVEGASDRGTYPNATLGTSAEGHGGAKLEGQMRARDIQPASPIFLETDDAFRANHSTLSTCLTMRPKEISLAGTGRAVASGSTC
jgi:hypothetical protein